MVFGGEGLGGEGECWWRGGGWGGVLVEMCRDLRGRGGIVGGCRRVKVGSMRWSWEVEGGDLRCELRKGVGGV